MTYTDWIGSIGVFLILLAYFLNVIGTLNHKDITFIILNLIGATLACIASVLLDYVPFIILEGAWVLVSLYALLTLKKSKLK
ncbi:CBU_0592 family membrane protein [Psychroserpens mesophilus]|uniref:CBU_0592 family membrane protein n=1 Tax=Psychroserpens mesophilus TaxID=325473 RepID=UPI003F490CF6